jgi:uncharacterized protein involved in exopolysaccharide biosynthesis
MRRVENSNSEEDLDLRDLVEAIWRQRWLILLITSAFGVASVIYALSATSWYRVEVTLLPVDRNSVQKMTGALAQLSGLAGLAGMNLGSEGDKVEPLAVLGSREFAARFIEDHALLPIIFADRWDAQHAKWKGGSDDAPDTRDAVDFFKSTIMRIAEDRKTGLIKLTVDWKQGDVAAAWANEMVAQVNSQLRGRALEDSEKNIAYLRSQVSNTATVSLQQSASRILESELEKAMVARGSEEYAFRVIDKAQPPKRRYWPRRTWIVLGGTIMGGILGCLVALIRYGVRKTMSPHPTVAR